MVLDNVVELLLNYGVPQLPFLPRPDPQPTPGLRLSLHHTYEVTPPNTVKIVFESTSAKAIGPDILQVNLVAMCGVRAADLLDQRSDYGVPSTGRVHLYVVPVLFACVMHQDSLYAAAAATAATAAQGLPELGLPELPSFLKPPKDFRSATFDVSYLDTGMRVTRGDR
jgi:hypothetical protein